MGICEVLKSRNSVLIVGEMGTGKTIIAIAVSYILSGSGNGNGKPSRTLVMCPGHLVRKWQREVQETVPGARAIIVRKLGDMMALEKDKRPPQVPEYVIVSKDRAKLGYAWRPAVIEKQGCYLCPQCQILITDRDGLPVSFSYLPFKMVIKAVGEGRAPRRWSGYIGCHPGASVVWNKRAMDNQQEIPGLPAIHTVAHGAGVKIF